MLHALQHPCIVSLIGISIHPLCFALELAPLGSLNTVLSENAKGTSCAPEHSLGIAWGPARYSPPCPRRGSLAAQTPGKLDPRGFPPTARPGCRGQSTDFLWAKKGTSPGLYPEWWCCW